MKVKSNFFPFSMLFFVSLIFLLVITLSFQVAWAEGENKKDLPLRALSVAPEYTGIIIEKGDDISIDIMIANNGRQDEFIDMELISVPSGWNASIETYSFEVTGLYVMSEKTKDLMLKAEPSKDVGAGEYRFRIKSQTRDREWASESEIIVLVEEKKKVTKSKNLSITTSYPVLQGPTDAKFEFSLEVENETDKDGIFNLIAQGPNNWEINFKPAYESKFISSLRIKAGQSQSMAVEVKPYLLAEPGNYPILIKVNSPDARAEAKLEINLTGTHKLDIGTPTGLLSLNALQGTESNHSFYIKNSGSAPQTNIEFLTFKPENWKIDFVPERIDTINPGELKQVEAIITPSSQALVGDYMIAIKVEAGKVSEDMELRVTVKTSTAWGWVGIGIIIFVIAGLVFLFIRMGRR